MKPSSLSFGWWMRFLGVLLCGHCLEAAAAEGSDSKLFRLHHDGLLRCTKSAASMRGIGKSLMFFDDFELSVDGQFQMIGSSRLVRLSGKGSGKPIQTEPVCVSIVAIGNVHLKFPETGEKFSAKTAVFQVSERTWILDGVPMKRSCGVSKSRKGSLNPPISSGVALGENRQVMSLSD